MPLELVARIVIKMSPACQCEGDGQFGGARVMNPGCITQDHAFRHVRQEVLDASGQGLDDLQPLHLSDAVEDLFALQIRQHVELDVGDRVRPTVTVSAIDVDVDAVGDSTESTLGFLDAGVRQPSDPLSFQARSSVSRCRRERGAAYRKTCRLDRRFHLGDPQRPEVEHGRGAVRRRRRRRSPAGNPRPGRRRRRR